ncbi:NUDIX hydrolase [Sneathiella sp. P13V-1]|uniref:NUDIX hydrolase n=1 Tax=Sneathiella sp. P13V-1 TaxID=2697366 RepID=UPI00187B6B65|nr:NUDIX hydrolase [Sneathiella sp. P13V-1]MBE7636276.1 NUDIX hydrolase [Sneathiella sp. P13V-1]
MTDKTAPLKPAATVLMVRDCDKPGDKLEVFMVVRHHQIDFASGALVFPGGKVDSGDLNPELSAYLPAGTDLSDPLLSFKIASIREAFEECHVLLARDKATGVMVAPARIEKLVDQYRKEMQAGDIDILAMAKAEELELATDQLAHYSHWITPTFMPKRFDTHFFIAIAPDEQLAIHDGEESVDSVWIGPNEAMDGEKDGKYTIIFPTMMNIEYLQRFNSAAEAVEKSAATPTVTVLPEMEITEEGKFLNIPAEADYSLTRRKIDPMMDPDQQKKK